jgi:hypothetical protein
MRLRGLTGENQTEESASNGGNLRKAEIPIFILCLGAKLARVKKHPARLGSKGILD